MKLVRYADRPDLLESRFRTLSERTFPEFLQNNDPGNLYWGRLYEDFPDFQVALVDGDELVAEAHALPVAWDGSDEDLPSGWDEAFVRGMTSDREPTVLSALAISVLVGVQPVLMQVPPKSLRSMIATFQPAATSRRARAGPACPVPMTIAS